MVFLSQTAHRSIADLRASRAGTGHLIGKDSPAMAAEQSIDLSAVTLRAAPGHPATTPCRGMPPPIGFDSGGANVSCADTIDFWLALANPAARRGAVSHTLPENQVV